MSIDFSHVDVAADFGCLFLGVDVIGESAAGRKIIDLTDQVSAYVTQVLELQKLLLLLCFQGLYFLCQVTLGLAAERYREFDNFQKNGVLSREKSRVALMNFSASKGTPTTSWFNFAFHFWQFMRVEESCFSSFCFLSTSSTKTNGRAGSKNGKGTLSTREGRSCRH